MSGFIYFFGFALPLPEFDPRVCVVLVNQGAIDLNQMSMTFLFRHVYYGIITTALLYVFESSEAELKKIVLIARVIFLCFRNKGFNMDDCLRFNLEI